MTRASQDRSIALMLVVLLHACRITGDDKQRRLDLDEDGSEFPEDCAPDDPTMWGEGTQRDGEEVLEICGDSQVNICEHSLEQAISDCQWTDETTLADAGLRVWGNEVEQLVNLTLASTLDMDGDGTRDIVVGAQAADAKDGAVYVLNGATRGQSTVSAAMLGSITAPRSDAYYLGLSLAAGYDEQAEASVTVVGAQDGDSSCTDGWINGTLLVSYGPILEALSAEDADLKLTICESEWPSGTHGTGLGASVALLPDADGSGAWDILTGSARWASPGKAVAWLVRDPADRAQEAGTGRLALHGDDVITFLHDLDEIWPDSELPDIGEAVADAGDVDGDGMSDIVLGASGSDLSGMLVFTGEIDPDGDHLQPISDATAILTANNTGAGSSVASAGDVNGDGLADLIIGQNTLYGWGAAVVLGVSGGNIDPDLDHAVAFIYRAWEGDYAGHAVVGGLNLNGDDLSDVAVSAPGSYGITTGWKGGVIVVTAPMEGAITPVCTEGGVRDGECAQYTVEGDDSFIVGEGANDDAGDALASAGDMNGDGLDDLLVGSSYYGADDVGAVYLMLTAY